MRIGIDFDNTIVCYDEVFFKAALFQNLIPSTLSRSKSAVRDYLRSLGKEDLWTHLQGEVYGNQMNLAHPFPGVADFLHECHQRQIPVFIISHKTRYPYFGPRYDLHEAAQRWLISQQFSALPQIYFELTLEKKLARISALQCTVFIDDLPELLMEKTFPSHVQKILFDPNNQYSGGAYLSFKTWKEFSKQLFST